MGEAIAMNMILTGDVNLINLTDPAMPFSLVRDEFSATDIVFCNLECCLYRPPSGHSIEHEGFYADPDIAGEGSRQPVLTPSASPITSTTARRQSRPRSLIWIG